MELKKNPSLEIGRNSSIYFAIGLNIMLFFTWQGLEYKTFDTDVVAQDILTLTDDIDEDIPITNIDAPPPPPPPPAAAAPDVITIVEDTEEIEETVIESSETNQDDEIADPVDVEEVQVEEVEEDVVVPFTVVEKVPIYPGCTGNNAQLKDCFNAMMQEHIRKNFNYPDSALEMGIHGKVFVLFAIDKDGRVTNIKTRGPAPMLEKEAERIIALLPTMEPGKQRGKPVKVPYSIPINFKIQQ